MCSLTLAGDDQLDAIYRESHGLWGAGLTLERYRGLWREMIRTTWGGRRAGLYVWIDDRGTLLSSVKLYRPELQVDGHVGRATVIGALFTPAARRGRGHAAALVRAVLDRARAEGDRWALLFSDIGTDYYEPFGFRSLPAEESWGVLPARPAPGAGWTLRPMIPEDGPSVRQAHDDFCRGRPLALLRDSEHWEFLDVRSRAFFDRQNDRRLSQRWQVALDGDRFAGYLITVEGRGEWNVREVGAPGGDPRAMAAVLGLGAEQARRAHLRSFYGWFPPGLADRLPEWGICTRARRRALPMLASLGPDGRSPDLTTPERAYLPFQDQF